ncbi:hypothetical protein GGF31_002552 [Allomyces arbusculus]|nr:hypothetical protein GGF31_002552 [Allomyces arbusculus]
MTYAEQVALAGFMRQYPNRTYLFHIKPAPTAAKLAGCFTANLMKWMKAIGHSGIGEQLWSQYAHEHGHTLKTVLTYYNKGTGTSAPAASGANVVQDADIAEVSAGSADMIQDVDMDEIAPGDTDALMEDVPAGSADVVQEAPMVQVLAGSADVVQAPPVGVTFAKPHTYACIMIKESIEDGTETEPLFRTFVAKLSQFAGQPGPASLCPLSEAAKMIITRRCDQIIKAAEPGSGFEDVISDLVASIHGLLAA